MEPILSGAQMRAWDGWAIEGLKIPARVLMENAGRACADRITLGLPTDHVAEVLILAGAGNNGGDGYVIARALQGHGARPRVLEMGDRSRQSQQSAANRALVEELGIPLEALDLNTEDAQSWEQPLNHALGQADVIVDALFGTGLSRVLGAAYARVLELASRSRAWKVAVDLPSGLSADDGRVLGQAFAADLTIALGARKWGHLLGAGPEICGELEVVDIGIPPQAEARHPAEGWWPTRSDLRALLPPRPANSHKGTFGHVLVLAGSEGTPGAAVLAARAALRSGAGLVTLGADEATRALGHSLCPEMMSLAARTGAGPEAPLDLKAISQILPRVTALVIGPGMGRGADLRHSLSELLEGCRIPAVLDADALRLFAGIPEGIRPSGSATVLTPHPGEMAALLERSPAEIAGDRLAAARSVAGRSGCTVILKGRGSLTASADRPVVYNPTGSPAMATAGSGDVLAGCVGALLGAGVPVHDAAWMGAWLHGRAGEIAAENVGEVGVIASDIEQALPYARAELLETSR